MYDLEKGSLKSSYFTGSYAWKLEPIPSHGLPDKKGWVFCFAGQGTSFPGMLKGLESLSTIKYRCGVANELALELKLPSPETYCLTPDALDEEELESIELFALLTAQVAITEALIDRGFRPRAVTSHSFGEYAGLVASGVLTFEDAFRVVADREKSCPPRNSAGYLLAVGGEEAAWRDCLQGLSYTVALKNGVTQQVLALRWRELIDAEARLKKAQLRFTRLNLPQPYHSPGLAPAARKMRTLLAARGKFAHGPSVPFLSSVSHGWLNGFSSGGEVAVHQEVVALLSEQLTEPVDFPQQVKDSLVVGDGFIEIGCRPILLPFLGETVKAENAEAIAIKHAFEILSARPGEVAVRRSLDPEKESALGDLIRKIIAKATGYRIEEISLEDRIQEDLGIDSLKFTEIMIQISETTGPIADAGLSFNFPKTVGDMVATAQNLGGVPSAGQAGHKIPHFERYLRGKISSPLPSIENSTPASFTVTSLNNIVSELESMGPHLILLAPKTTESEGEIRGLVLRTTSALLKWTLKHGRSKTKLAFCIEYGASPISTGMVGFLKSLRKELKLGALRILYYDKLPPVESLTERVTGEFAAGKVIEVFLEKGIRYLEAFQPSPLDQLPLKPMKVLAVGGAKGILAELISSTVWAPGTEFILWGRTKALSLKQEEWLSSLSERGVKAVYFSVDAAEEAAVRAQLGYLQSLGGVTQIWNGAGKESSREFQSKSESEIWSEFDSKWSPSKTLSDLCHDLPVKRFIQFSSLIAHTGNRGQTIYAAANAAVDRALLQSLPQSTALTVLRWPPWDHVGMTADPLIATSLRSAGVSLLSKERAVELFAGEMAQSTSEGSPVYYYDSQDDLLYDWPVTLNESQTKLLGKSVVIDGQLSFVQLYTKESEPYLWDHTIGSETVFPAALGVTLFSEAVRVMSDKCGRLTDFKIHKPISTRQNALAIRLGGGKTSEGFSMFIGNPSPCFSVNASAEGYVPGPMPAWGEAIEIVQASSLYRKDLLFHGPSFRIERDIETGEGHLSCVVSGKGNPLFQRGMGMLPFALDSALQLLYLACYRKTKHDSLPTTIESIWLSDRLLSKETSEVRVVVLPSELSSTSVVGDAYLIAPGGELLAAFTKIRHAIVDLSARRS